MPRHYSQTIEIRAAPKQVWPVMADVTRWAEWTPSIKRVVPLTAGPLRAGSRARVHQPGLPPAFWRVTEWHPGQHFTWVSVAPGVRVTARHEVTASPTGSRVTLSLNFDGLLGGLLARLTYKFNVSYLELEANGLKARCEALAMGRTVTAD
jgi:carbon monoxide dehydrogenase subunit G